VAEIFTAKTRAEAAMATTAALEPHPIGLRVVVVVQEEEEEADLLLLRLLLRLVVVVVKEAFPVLPYDRHRRRRRQVRRWK
jgi:hypothetical protein